VTRFVLACSCVFAQACAASPPSATIPPPGAFVSTGSAVDRAFESYANDRGLRAERAEVRSEYEGQMRGEQLPPPSGIVAEGLEAGEALVSVPGGPDMPARTALRTPPRLESCIPAPHTEYRVAHAADGTVVIARLVPTITTKTEHRPGSCAVACGPVPVRQSDLLLLPETTHVRVETVPWETVFTVVTCDHPYGMP
jgi:hypothetical protein